MNIPGIPDNAPALPGASGPLDYAYAVLSAASAAQVDLIEAVRAGEALPLHMASAEIVENLADALQSAIAIEQGDPDPDPERQQALAQLRAAVALFLEGWAA